MNKNFENFVRVRKTKGGPELYIGNIFVRLWIGTRNDEIADLKRNQLIGELNKYVDQRETPAVAKCYL